MEERRERFDREMEERRDKHEREMEERYREEISSRGSSCGGTSSSRSRCWSGPSGSARDSGALDQVTMRLEELGEDIRAQTEAIFRMLDRFQNGGGESATS